MVSVADIQTIHRYSYTLNIYTIIHMYIHSYSQSLQYLLFALVRLLLLLLL